MSEENTGPVAELNAAVAAYVASLGDSRESLSSDQLASLASPRARLEKAIEPVEAFIFTIDGVLQGEKKTGMLFAGEAMLVRAKSEREAIDLANSGLRETVRLLHEEYETRAQRSGNPYLTIETGGRRGRPTEGEPLLNNPELRAMLDAAFRGKKR